MEYNNEFGVGDNDNMMSIYSKYPYLTDLGIDVCDKKDKDPSGGSIAMVVRGRWKVQFYIP